MASEMEFASGTNATAKLSAELDRKAKLNADPGDTGKTPIRNGVAKETSASVVGPMLPQTPLTGSTVKKGEEDEMEIPKTLLEFVYYPDSVYNERVDAAVHDFATGIQQNTLPFKLRKMIIERAMLRVKIAWCSKFKNKEEKIKNYKKRYREVDSAINRIQKAVINDGEKKKMAKAIDAIDKEVTRKTQEQINRKEIVESVNAMLSAMVESGCLPADMPMIDDPFLPMLECTLTDFTDGEPFTEGENLNLVKSRLLTKKDYIKEFRAAKKAMKAGDCDAASKHIKNAKKYVSDFRKVVEKYPKEEISVNFIGMVLGYLGFCLRSALSAWVVALPTTIIGGIGGKGIVKATLDTFDDPEVSVQVSKGSAALMGIGGTMGVIGGIALSLYNLYKIVRSLDANIKESKKKNDLNVFNLLNGVYNKALVMTRQMEKELDKLSGEVKKAKKEIAAKESTDEDPLVFFHDLTTMYEAGKISLDVYCDWYTEAKKPDDGMMEILDILNRKGYKTKYSCTGHKSSFKEDRDENGVINGKLSSGARIMFQGDYKFPDPPKHWGWKMVDGKDYLYVLAKSHNADKVDVDKAFDAWKNKYMASLRRWVESLPEQKGAVITKNSPKKEEDVTERAWDGIDQFLDTTDDALFESVDRDLEDEIAMLLL